MASTGVKVGLTVLGIAGVFLGTYAAIRALQTGGGGPPPPGGCSSGQFKCSSGVCCPNGDFCANTDGTCPSGSSPDPAYPGCCLSACPPSCTVDSDCGPCGASFVCENGACTKQIPAFITGGATLDFPYGADYTSTCCYYPWGPSCNKCNFGIGFSSPYLPGLTFVVVDATLRPVPNALVGLRTYLNYGLTATLGFARSNAQGQVFVNFNGPVHGASPFNAPNYGAYPCNACGEGGTIDGSFTLKDAGSIVVYSLDNPAVQAETIVTVSVDWKQTVNELTGCPCL